MLVVIEETGSGAEFYLPRTYMKIPEKGLYSRNKVPQK